MNKNIEISLIKTNIGQIKGLPKNPRTIKDDKFKALVAEIAASDEFLKARPVLVVENEGVFVIIGGEQRFKACKELKFKTIPCYVFPASTTVEEMKKYTIKDNQHAGEFVMHEIQADWGVEFGFEAVDFDWSTNNGNEFVEKEVGNAKSTATAVEDDIDFDNISSNENREVAQKIIICTCPNCNHTFNI